MWCNTEKYWVSFFNKYFVWLFYRVIELLSDHGPKCRLMTNSKISVSYYSLMRQVNLLASILCLAEFINLQCTFSICIAVSPHCIMNCDATLLTYTLDHLTTHSSSQAFRHKNSSSKIDNEFQVISFLRISYANNAAGISYTTKRYLWVFSKVTVVKE